MDIEILNNLSNPDAGKYVKKLITQSNSEFLLSTKVVKKIFTPPTVDEISNYCFSRKNTIDPNQFFDFYQSKNWYVGKSKMKDWQACVRTWERNRPKNEVIDQAKYGRMTQDSAMNIFSDAINVKIS